MSSRSCGPLIQFSGQVQALLSQSQPAFIEINELFQQMQIAGNGGIPSITLAEGEQTITSVIANRTSLAASARVLTRQHGSRPRCAMR